MNVLIVIEDPKFRHALDTFLRSETLSPLTVGSIDAARERGLPEPVDLIFVSETLGAYDPRATHDIARALPGADLARIVAVSASRTPPLRALYEAGFDGIVGPGSSADEIAAQAILASRPRPVGMLPGDYEPFVEAAEAASHDDLSAAVDEVDEVAAEPAPALSARGTEILSTLKMLGYYLAHDAPSERQAQHALHAIDLLAPGIPAVIVLRADERHGLVLVPGADLPTSFTDVAYSCYAGLSDAEWDAFATGPRVISREHDAAGPFGALVSPDAFGSVLHIGLISSERTLGVLALFSASLDEPDAHDVVVLETIASMTAVAITHDIGSPATSVSVEQAPVGLPWEQLFESFPVPAFVVDENGLFVATNGALSALSGISPEGMRLLSVYDLLADPDIDAASEALASLLGDESPAPATLPVAVKHGSDDVLPLRLTLQALPPEAWDGTPMVQGVLREPAHDSRESARLAALQDIASIVATERDVDAAATGVLASLSQRLGFPRGVIWTINGDGTTLLRRAALTEDVPETISSDAGIVGRVFNGWQHELASRHGAGDPGAATDLIYVPIVHADRIFGVLQIESDESQPFSECDLSFFTPIAAQIAGIIERDSLYQHLEHQALTDQVTDLPNRQAFQQRLDEAVSSLDKGVVSLLVLGVDGFKEVNELYGYTIADDVLRQIGAELNQRVAPQHMLAKYTSDQFVVLLPGVDRDEAVNIAEGLRINLATHLFTVAEQVEQLTVSIGAATCPDDAEASRSLLQAADHAMYLAKRAGRNQTFQSNAAFATLAPAHGRINDLLRQSPRETLSLLIRAMDQRLPERAGHSERVTRYALAIARELGVPDAELPRLRLAAYIHDIGMVSLPDALLRKPSQLSPEERGLLRGVPVAAHGLLSQLDLNESVLLSVLHQRENYDGSGYPSGLRGETIPLGARIIAVADALDAMTSVRAHRQPMTLEQALEQVSQQASKQFDPQVVQAAYCLTDVISEPVSIPMRGENGRSEESSPTMTGVTGELRLDAVRR